MAFHINDRISVLWTINSKTLKVVVFEAVTKVTLSKQPTGHFKNPGPSMFIVLSGFVNLSLENIWGSYFWP